MQSNVVMQTTIHQEFFLKGTLLVKQHCSYFENCEGACSHTCGTCTYMCMKFTYLLTFSHLHSYSELLIHSHTLKLTHSLTDIHMHMYMHRHTPIFTMFPPNTHTYTFVQPLIFLLGM